MFGSSYSSLMSSKLSHSSTKLINKSSKVMEIGKSLESMYGDDGYSKMVVDMYDRIIISSSASVVLKSMKVADPLQLLIREYVEKVAEYGDCSGYLVVLFIRLLRECRELVVDGVNVGKLVDVFRELRAFLNEKMDGLKIDEDVIYSDKKVMSKILKGVLKNNTLEKLLLEVLEKVDNEYDLDGIRINKVACGALDDSYVVEGMIFSGEPSGNIKNIKDGKTVIFNCPLDISRTETKGTVLFKSAEELINFSTNEEKEIKKLVDSIDTDVVICNGEIEKRHLDFFNKNGVLVFKIQSKYDIKRIRRMLGGVICLTLNAVRKEHMGRVKEVITYREGNKVYTKFLSPEEEKDKIFSIVLKDSINANMDEYERIIEQGITVIKKNVHNKKILLTEGGGKFEDKISNILEEESKDFKDIRRIVYDKVALVFRELRNIISGDNEDMVYDIFIPKTKATLYAVDILCNILLTEDILVSKSEDMQIKQPTGNWDAE